MLRHVTKLLSLCMAIMLAAPVAAQQAYPSKPVRLIVPFPPGGANDIVARLIGQRLNDRWARAVVIDNRAGAGGNIGTEIGARAVPDG
jgi:tripartite-type tricarboxylate transporter receptor subunit TctC